ncbi:hypothetical protein Trydic_g13392 [Trypoxylus dichotomus]
MIYGSVKLVWSVPPPELSTVVKTVKWGRSRNCMRPPRRLFRGIQRAGKKLAPIFQLPRSMLKVKEEVAIVEGLLESPVEFVGLPLLELELLQPIAR